MPRCDALFKNITAIVFDLDDTLWPCMPTINRAELASYQWLQQSYPRISDHYTEKGIFEYRKTFMNSHPQYRVDLSLMRKEMLAQLAREFDYEESPMVEQGFELFYRLRHDVTFYEDVFPILDQLRPHYRMGSISNGNASAGLTELNDYFSFYINAADVMASKPDLKIFQAFCEGMGVNPEQCLYIGDDPVYDIQGAQNAGMQTMWINRDNMQWPQSITQADAEITDLHQLLELLE